MAHAIVSLPDLAILAAQASLRPPSRATHMSGLDTEGLLDLLLLGSLDSSPLGAASGENGLLGSISTWPSLELYAFSHTDTAPFSLSDCNTSCQFMIDTVDTTLDAGT